MGGRGGSSGSGTGGGKAQSFTPYTGKPQIGRTTANGRYVDIYKSNRTSYGQSTGEYFIDGGISGNPSNPDRLQLSARNLAEARKIAAEYLNRRN